MSENLVIGITGGIAAGKSTCAHILKSWGVDVLEADDIAKAILSNNPVVIEACVDYFGTKILTDTNIDRKKLRQVIFANNSARLWLNQLMHPIIRQELLLASQKQVKLYHALVIPLLFEGNFDYKLNKVVSVISQQQLSRAMIRDNTSRNAIQQVLSTQVSDAHRIQHSDYLIYNDGQSLEAQLQVIHADLLKFKQTLES